MPLSHYGKILAAETVDGERAYAVVLVDSDGEAITSSPGVAPSALLKTYLTNGGSNDLTVDGSSAAVEFGYTVPAGKRLFANRVMIYLEDATNFSGELFGGASALSTGVVVSAAGVELVRWNDNIDLTATMFDTEGRKNFSKDTQSISGRWTMSSETGKPIILEAGETFAVTVNDNLTGLVHFRVKLGGRLEDI